MTSTNPALATSTLWRFVEDVHVIAPIRGGAHRVDRLPDGRTALIFRCFEGGRQGDIFVAGPRTRAMLKEATGLGQAVLLQVKPGWSTPIFGVPTNELTNSWMPLAELWGGSIEDSPTELLDLLGERCVPELLDRLARAFVVRANQSFEPASARLARRAAHLMEEGAVRVEDVARRLGVTARHLRRAFLENIGIGPKDFARSVRLQRALRLTSMTSAHWARIAVDAGYYDQSHLIADFQELVGLTPGAFLERAGGRSVAAAR